MKKPSLCLFYCLAMILIVFWCGPALSEEKRDLSALPVKGMVTMIDLGADKCIPCKMMAPIIEEVRAEYKGKAAILFVDVWKDKAPARKFNIRMIPTQIFFDKTGKEVFRHEGFMDKKTMITYLIKLGVNPG